MEVPATPENRALASAIQGRLKADSRQITANATFWKALGVGGGLCLAGIGIGAALFGYSYVTDGTTSADRIAEAITRALRDTTFKATGEVALDTRGASIRMEDGKVTLDQPAMVRLDPGATVGLDPNAKVRVEGGRPADLPRPVSEQLTPPKASRGPDIATTFTIFKTVKFGTGVVVTGWVFSSSDQPAPSTQFCYFGEDAGRDGTSLRFDLAQNGILTTAPAPSLLGAFDVKLAGRQCVWFDGGATRTAL